MGNNPHFTETNQVEQYAVKKSKKMLQRKKKEATSCASIPEERLYTSSDHLLKFHPSQQRLNEEENLNIKQNMKAGVGILFKEESYKDVGPSYENCFVTKKHERPPSKIKYSRSEYNKRFSQDNNNLKNRAYTFIRDHFASTQAELEEGLDRISQQFMHMTEMDKAMSAIDQNGTQNMNSSEMSKIFLPMQKSQSKAKNVKKKEEPSRMHINSSMLSSGYLDRSQILIHNQPPNSNLVQQELIVEN